MTKLSTKPGNIHEKHSLYSARHLDSESAQGYQNKFKRSFFTRLSAAREMRIVARALDEALALSGSSTAQPTILDYPCGAGRFSIVFANHTSGYLAGDHSPHMVQLALQTLADAGMRHLVIGTTDGDLRATSLSDDCVDIAACMRLIHHFPSRDDRVTIMKELRRVCKGSLLISFIDAGSVKQRWHCWRYARAGKPVTRVLVSLPDFANEALEARWEYQKSWQLSSFFSGICVALLTPLEA